jgi:hypothetical protein
VRRIGFFAAGLGIVLLLVLVIPQIILPGIAAQRLRHQLERSGRVLKVEVDAFPAIKLLWHQADHVVIRMASYRSSARKLSTALGQVGDTGSLDASATRLMDGLLTLHDARLQKRGRRLTASATITESDLRASFPVLDGVEPVESSAGRFTLQGTATVFGVSATVDATVRPENGALVVSPDLPFGGLATITLFSSPAIAVEGVAARSAPGGFALTARARVR